MLQLRSVNAAHEIRRIPADLVVIGSPYDFDLEVVATEDHSEAKFGASVAGYLQANTGSGFAAVPADVQSGFDLGAFSAGERKAITLRLTVPLATELRNLSIELLLGIGV